MQPQQTTLQLRDIAVPAPAAGRVQIRNLHLPTRLIGALCLLTLCATLVAGLWPFCAPKNEVSWIKSGNGIRLGANGTLLSTVALPAPHEDGACTVEIWLAPAKVWKTGTVLTVYDAKSDREFSIEQDFTDLVLTVRDGRGKVLRASEQLRVTDVFRRNEFFLSVSSDGARTSVYLDGDLAAIAPNFRLSRKDLTGQVIVGNSPFRDRSWSGEVRGLAIYRIGLTSTEIQQGYRNWQIHGAPTPSERMVAVAAYSFDERTGSVVANAISSAANLYIPKRFTVVDQYLFESPLSEFRNERNYLKNALINVAGFVPLGFIVALYFTTRRIRGASILTVILGATVSIAIEYFQSYLPTRYSGLTDIITNTAGTYLGALLSRLAVSFVGGKGLNTPVSSPANNLL